MKRITWVRHAKSSWAEDEQRDHDRPLNKRGLHDAPEMGRRLAAREVQPDVVISSSAVRAMTTARLVVEALGLDPTSIKAEPRMYLADVDKMLGVLAELPPEVGHAMIFWHNPGITDAGRFLVNMPVLNIPTCGVLCADFEVSAWSGIGATRGVEVFYDYPKQV
ncbi:MAG: phosphohistidine phosphatase [Kiritimatiellia bacterium]|jgi:phosphohistidine phosphatase